MADRPAPSAGPTALDAAAARSLVRAVTIGDALLFFLPLVFMTPLNMISKSIIHAFLARLLEPEITLAAFSISFAFYYTLTSSTEVNTLLSISYLRDRRAVRHLLGFFCLVVGPPVLLTQVVAWTPLGVWLYGGLFGGSAEVIAQAQRATFWFAFSAPVLMARSLAFGLIMVHRRTIWITLSTLLRLLSLGVSLLLLPRVLHGAAVGAAALVTCMAVEAAFACWAARGFFRALPAEGGERPRYRDLWRFAWPLMMSQCMEMGIVMTINIFLGRLPKPDLALASFGVTQGLANVVISPMRNLMQTAQTLARTRADVRVLLRFTHYLVAAFTVGVALAFFTPLRHAVLAHVMGLRGDLLAYSEPAVMVTFLVAGAWGYAALFRGLLASARRTRTVAVSALARLGVAVAVGSSTLFLPGANGAVIGVAAWAATFGAEALLLGWRLLNRRPGAAPLFPESPVPPQAPQTGEAR
jgi:progressive ankylosis protein